MTDHVVAGAGPAGCLLAMLLAEQGHDVTLLERRPDLRVNNIDAGRSINLALATRGITALERVGLMERVDEILIPMVGRMVHEPDGDAVLQRYGSRDDEVVFSVSRNDLNAILLDGAERSGRVRIRFDTDVEGVDLGARRIVLRDHTTDEIEQVGFETIYGTDGAGSLVRAAMEAAGHTAVVEEPLDHGYKELTIPPGPDGRHRLDPNALHIWARGQFMLIALANPPGDFTLTLFLPNEGGPDSFAGLDSEAAVEAFFERHFADTVGLIPGIARQFAHNPTGRLGTIRCTGWSAGDAAVILGDAAHAIVPFHGQGMNAALESALVLDRHLAASPDDRAAAFAAFEAERRPDADAIADMALDNYVEMRSDVIDDRYVLRRALALELERRFPDHFVPRYTMVMFRTMPYSEARSRAATQLEILHALTDGIDSIDDVDWDRAARLVVTDG